MPNGIKKVVKKKETKKDKSVHMCCDKERLFKEKYDKLFIKYNLPNFKELNEDFDITEEDINSYTILRDIRKAMIVKFSGFLNFTELLLNPTNGQMFNMFLSRGIGEKEKDSLNILFEKLGGIVVSSLVLDVIYDENKEAEFIRDNFNEWQKMKKEIYEMMSFLGENWGKANFKKQKSYFG
ncbi:MAG TPA: hypothetical protein P5277_04660 [Candidatus Paceibacterota bacterium]|nr:hypothetical protein [Candidatus Paceibacterota bacterium]